MPAHVPEGVWQRESRYQEAFSGMLWNLTVILEIMGVTERCLPYLISVSETTFPTVTLIQNHSVFTLSSLLFSKPFNNSALIHPSWCL